ncbi:MAG: hypothetical protein EZS28_053292 [Streblomastix strix]|uniref:Uncharacterized protein n=1 Tax=Streblomastix strix TaxID=222440 RepID=A0A5J4RE07_9EUKA|nr:MAG: hypothetical protein EZS28_053292 [Streblomastix strix]
MNLAQVQLQYMRGQVMRRQRLLGEQRNMFFKEILILKNQIFGKQRQGDFYVPDTTDIFNPEEWLDKQMENDSGVMNEQAKRKITKEILDQIGQRVADEKRQLEKQIRVWCSQKTQKTKRYSNQNRNC